MNLQFSIPMAVAVVLLSATVGCDRHSTQVAPEVKPAEPALEDADTHLQTSNRWIENVKLDLMTPEGTFLRAAVESMDRALFAPGGGIAAIEAGGYPGIVHAFNNSADPSMVAGIGDKNFVLVGTDYWEVVDFRRTGAQFSAAVCNYGSTTAVKRRGDFEHPGRTRPAGHGVVLTFGPDSRVPPRDQRAPMANQRGDRRRPAENVFGTWVMTQYKNYSLHVELPQCDTTLAPGTPPDAPDHRYYNETPPQTLPPSPGWP